MGWQIPANCEDVPLKKYFWRPLRTEAVTKLATRDRETIDSVRADRAADYSVLHQRRA